METFAEKKKRKKKQEAVRLTLEGSILSFFSFFFYFPLLSSKVHKRWLWHFGLSFVFISERDQKPLAAATISSAACPCPGRIQQANWISGQATQQKAEKKRAKKKVTKTLFLFRCSYLEPRLLKYEFYSDAKRQIRYLSRNIRQSDR